MKTNDIIIRTERENDYREVENLVRESFWNVYAPGCTEHFVLKRLRDCADFVPELDFVMEKDGKIIGQNVCRRREKHRAYKGLLVLGLAKARGNHFHGDDQHQNDAKNIYFRIKQRFQNQITLLSFIFEHGRRTDLPQGREPLAR